MAEMSKADWNRAIEKLLEDDNKLKGMVSVMRDERTDPQKIPVLNRLVTEDLIRHFGEAVGDPNPLWRDPNYARNTRWGSIIAPPTFDRAIGHSVVVLLQPIGRIPGWLGYYGGTKRVHLKPIRPGDKFRAVDKYLGITEKSNPAKPYRFFFQSNERSFINQRDEVVVISIGYTTNTAIPPGEKDSMTKSVFAGRERHHFTKEELDFIHHAYEEEIEGKWRQGAEVRYWEDVVEGDELHPVIKGPLDISDTVSFLAAVGMAWEGGFAMKWKMIKATANDALIDPVSGEYHAPIDMHYLDSIARQNGVPWAYATGVQNEANLAHLVTNWMGDDGFVKRSDFSHRALLFMGDMSTQKGKVRKKYVENGEHLVDLEIWGETQDGIRHTIGNVTVRLVSRAK